MQMKKQRERRPGLSPYALKRRGITPRASRPTPERVEPPAQKKSPVRTTDLPAYPESEISCTVVTWKGSYVIAETQQELIFVHMAVLSLADWTRMKELHTAKTPIELMCAAPVGEIPPGKKFRATTRAWFPTG